MDAKIRDLAETWHQQHMSPENEEGLSRGSNLSLLSLLTSKLEAFSSNSRWHMLLDAEGAVTHIFCHMNISFGGIQKGNI